MDGAAAVKDRTSREAIREFLERLRNAEGDNLLQAVLFGSMARGDAHEDSDIDIFILLRNYDRTGTEKVAIKDRILDIAAAVEDRNNHKVYISPFICSEESYMRNRKNDLIFYNIADEGVLLYDKNA